MTKTKHIPGWTLSETLVMMIVAGVIFLAVMDGMVLFNRYTQRKTAEITANMSLYEGYYRLRHLTATADSISAENGHIRLYRQTSGLAELTENDSLLVARTGTMTDTLMSGRSGLRVSESRGRTGADSLCLTITESAGGHLNISFPVKPPVDRQIMENLREQEKQYAYEEP